MDQPIEIEKEVSIVPSVPIMGTMTTLEAIFGNFQVGFEVGKFLYYRGSLAQVSGITEAGTVDLIGFGMVKASECSVLKNSIMDHFPTSIEILPPRDRCWVSPEVIITDTEHKIRCPKCFTIARGKTYAEAYDRWYEHCK